LHLKTAMSAIRAYERPLGERPIAGLREIPDVTIHGITDLAGLDQRAPTAAFALEDYTPHQTADRLVGESIFVWDGNYGALAVTEPSEDSLRPPVGTCPKGGRRSNGAIGPGKYVCRKAPAGG
jgi:selenocysteine lyase/cysteine desulfurase